MGAAPVFFRWHEKHIRVIDTVLYPADDSDAAEALFGYAVDLAEVHGAELHVLNVADTSRESVTRVGGEVVDTLVREGERIVAGLADSAKDRTVPITTEVQQGRPYVAIREYAAQADIDLIVMPTHGRDGLERLLLGSVTERVIRRSDTPVLTIRPDTEISAEIPYEDVLVPTDGSDCATAALDLGIDFVTASTARLHLLSVVDLASLGADVHSGMLTERLEEHASNAIETAIARAEEAGAESVSGTVEEGTSIHQTILSYVDANDVDLIITGTHGRTGFDRYLLGSVTEKLVRTSPVPVVTVRGSGPEDTD